MQKDLLLLTGIHADRAISISGGQTNIAAQKNHGQNQID